MNRATIRRRGLLPVLLASLAAFAGFFAFSDELEVHAGSKTPQVAGTNPATPGLVWFEGACDASGAVGLDERRFLLADDEDNVLRVYDAERGGKPLFETDLSPELGQMGKKRGKEADLEGGARLGDTAYFLSSHGRKSNGKYDENRLLLFATTLPETGARPALVGRPYRALLDELTAHPALRELGLAEASERAPKAPGGLNIEGLGVGPDGSLLLGFRSPVPEGRALLVRLNNPSAVVTGARALLSGPMYLHLGGLGIRAISEHRGQHLLAAGSSGDGGRGKLYRWDGKGDAVPLTVTNPGFETLNPEALFTPEARDEFLVLSDDGTELIGGRACKKLKNSKNKRFRGMWVQP